MYVICPLGLFLGLAKMPVIAVAHHKGGAGKTTSSVHILGEIKVDEVVDLDIHKGISIINQFRPDGKKWSVTVITDKKILLQNLEKLDEAKKTVFIDCGGFDADINRAAIAVADLVIVPSNDSVPERLGLATFDKVLDEVSQQVGIDIQAHILLCKTHPNQKHFPDLDDILDNAKHLQLLESRLSYRTGRYGFQNTLRDGMGITEVKHGRTSTAGREVIALVKEIEALLKSKG